MTSHFLNDSSLKSEPTCKLINRIPGSRLLISSLPGSASRTHVESRGKPRDSTIVLKALPGKLDIKRHSPAILYFKYTPSSMVAAAGDSMVVI